MIGLLEYQEDGGNIHLNLKTGDRFEHRPFTNGFMPVCMMDDEIRDDEDFSAFRFEHIHCGLSYDDFFSMMNAFLEGRYPGKRDVWKINVDRMKSEYSGS